MLAFINALAGCAIVLSVFVLVGVALVLADAADQTDHEEYYR